jgi:hypothetical protein
MAKSRSSGTRLPGVVSRIQFHPGTIDGVKLDGFVYNNYTCLANERGKGTCPHDDVFRTT